MVCPVTLGDIPQAERPRRVARTLVLALQISARFVPLRSCWTNAAASAHDFKTVMRPEQIEPEQSLMIFRVRIPEK